MKNPHKSVETPKGCLSCSENASKNGILRADTNANAFLILRLLFIRTQFSSDVKIRMKSNIIFEHPTPLESNAIFFGYYVKN